MKKIITGLMLLVATLTLTSCIEMTSETKLEFEKLPEAVITTENETGSLDASKILVKINETVYTLEAAQKAGAIVEGLEYTLGYNTLLVTYKEVTIAFTYLVNGILPDVFDTSWYTGAQEGQKVFEISTAAELRGLAKLVNKGTQTFKNMTVKLGADIDLAGYAWTPIGESSRKDENGYIYSPNCTFQGTFDGQGHVIKNLTDAGYVAAKGENYQSNAVSHKIYGYVYGLFGAIHAEDVVIKNVKLENVAINGISVVDGVVYVADSVAGIVGWSGAGYFTISDCEVTGEINGFDAVGGIVGRLYDQTKEQAQAHKISNCINRANVLASASSGSKCAGIAGYLSNEVKVDFSGCENYGSFECAGIADAYYVRANNTTVTFDNYELIAYGEKYNGTKTWGSSVEINK